MFLGREQIHHPGYSRLEKTYIAAFGVPIVGLRIRARNVFSLIPKNRHYERILDAGSGTGVFSFELGRRFPDARVLGVDVLEEAITACRYVARKTRTTNVKFRWESIERLEYRDAFDLTLCIDILEHIVDDVGALRRLYNAAAPRGILLLHVPACYRRYPIWKKNPNFDVETHVRIGYQPEQIRDKVTKVGFSVRDSGFTYGFLETLANNVSYMITHARMQNKGLYSLVFPLLNLISWLGARARSKNLGAGIFVVAEKPGAQSEK